MARRRVSSVKVVVEVLDAGDLVALAQCHALDASVFPHPSLPAIFSVPAVLVARDRPGGPVVGFVATARNGDEIEIRGLAVERERRRSGVGRALVKAVLKEARERRAFVLSLHVSTANGAALALYENEGFTRSKRIERFYSPERFGDGGDAWRMVRRLGRR